jgi:hypothetical protein
MFITKFIKEKYGTNFGHNFFKKSLEQISKKNPRQRLNTMFFKKFRICQKENFGTKIRAKTF